MKFSSLFLIPGLVLLGLTLTRDDKSPLISQKKNAPVRSVANAMSGKCMRDLFSTEDLKKEITELESNLDTNRIEGQWRHIDLSKLPTPAADFLKKHGDKIGEGNSTLPVETCEDVPCLFNLAYGTPDGIAGLVHYLWFLRTGTYLSADNQVPGQASPNAGEFNGQTYPLSSYLYDESELLGLWRLSKMVRSPFTTLTYLKEVQRIPRGAKMEGRNSGACGLAHSDGWITLADQCLIVYPRSDAGYLYSAVLHELAHQLDYEQGKREYDDLYRSQREDYLALTGFSLREYQNSVGQTVREWSLKPGARVVSAYGRGSPAESFAELLAYYRTDADSAKTKVDSETWTFATNYFHGQSFENQEILNSWISSATLKKTKEILRTFITCESPECLSQGLDSLASEEVARIRSDETDGCRVLSNPLVSQSLPGQLKAAFTTAGEKILADSSREEVNTEIIERFDEILEPAAAYESFFACHSSGKDCYEEKVKEKKDLSPLLLSVYLQSYPYEKVAEEVTMFYESLLASRTGVLRVKGDELWESCKAIPSSDTQPPTGSDFIVREGYMVSSFYNCLNRGFASALNGSLDAVKLKEFTPRNPDERAFILNLMRQQLTVVLEDKLRSSRAYEVKMKDAFTEQLGVWLYNSMRSNRWWFPRGRVDQATIEAKCRESAVNLIGGDIFFHLKKDLYKDLLISTCKDIR